MNAGFESEGILRAGFCIQLKFLKEVPLTMKTKVFSPVNGCLVPNL